MVIKLADAQIVAAGPPTLFLEVPSGESRRLRVDDEQLFPNPGYGRVADHSGGIAKSTTPRKPKNQTDAV